MATIIPGGAKFPDRNYFCGPFKAPNDAIYVVLLVTGDLVPEVYKATDPLDSFSVQDTGNKPTHTLCRTLWAYLSGSEIHIATGHDSTDGPEVEYHLFETSDDTWTTVDEEIEDTKNADGNASIGVRSDGDIIVLYNGTADSDMGQSYTRVDYAREEGGGWTVGVDVGGTTPAAEDRQGCTLVRGSGDNMHFFWVYGLGAGEKKLRANTLDSTNGLGTERSSTTGLDIPRLNPGIHFTEGATEHVIVPFKSGTNFAVWVWRFTESSGDLGAPEGETQISEVANDVRDLNDTAVMCSAVDGNGEAYLMWSQSSTWDLFRDNIGPPYSTAEWGTDIEELDAVSIDRISCNIYTRDGGTKLAYVYVDNGGAKYGEVGISAAAVGPILRRTLIPFELHNLAR